MRIWLVTVGEPLPIDKGVHRLLRTGMLAEELARMGHEVTWWCSTFDHYRKKHRFQSTQSKTLYKNLTFQFLHGPGYKKNVSFARYYHHKRIAAEFRKLIATEKKTPHLIVSSLPTLELCEESVRYGNKKNVPVILDLRDMWPDIYRYFVPKVAAPFMNIALKPLEKQMGTMCKKAHGLTGVTPSYLEWGLNYAEREQNAFDRVFWHCYRESYPDENKLTEARSYWSNQGLHRDKDFICCFFSSLSNKLNLDTIIKAAPNLKPTTKIVICGAGDDLSRLQSLARGIDNILFPGWIDGTKIWALMEIAHVGLAPFKNRKDFIDHIPNKIVEYLAAGLPIVSSVRGYLSRILHEEECGLTYAEEDELDFAQQIQQLDMNSAKLLQMKENARRLFEKQFSQSAVIPKMARHYSSVAAGTSQ